MYGVINAIIIDNVDEELLIERSEIASRIQKMTSVSDLKIWEDLDGDVVIGPIIEKPRRDSIYTSTLRNPLNKGIEPYRVLVSSILFQNKPYRLVARISLLESEDLIKAIATTQLAVLLVLISGLFIVNWWISRRIWQPFYRTLEELKKFEIDKRPDPQLQPSTIKEFEDLNGVITQLTERVHQIYLNQKEFTENAAHELQTPLTIFQTKLELLIQTDLSASQGQIAESLIEASLRMVKLNKALLLLSKIDNRQFPEIEVTSISDITSKLISRYEPEATAKHICIGTSIANNFPVAFNITLIDVLFSNLISNAIRHSAPHSKITIMIGGNLWQIQNEGHPMTISPKRLFERFQKSVTSSSGMGLGLAIVKKICDTSGLDLDYRFEENSHRFSVKFPELKI
jgi:signal transduction histidine kinase